MPNNAPKIKNSMNIEIFNNKIEDLHSILETVWPSGREKSCTASDGHHYSLPGHTRPVSLGRVESHFLFNLVVAVRAKRVFEIGTAFGYSSFWLGFAVHLLDAAHGWVGSIDNHSEGTLGREGFDFAHKTAEHIGLTGNIQYFVGNSPTDIHKYLTSSVDLAFIDGDHNGLQPAEDYRGLKPYLENARLLVWHDVQARYNVKDGLSEAIADGWSPIVFPTSCRMCVCYKHYSDWTAAISAFQHAEQLTLMDPS